MLILLKAPGVLHFVKEGRYLKVGSCPNNDKSVQFSFLSFSV